MSSKALLHDAARKLLASSRFDDAELTYSRILELDPGDDEAVGFVSSRAMRRGDLTTAIGTLERAESSAPDTHWFKRELGLAYKANGNAEAALHTLNQAAELDATDYVARLLIGDTLERMGDSYGALTSYFGALTLAQMRGVWLDDSTTPLGHREGVKHATRYVNAGRASLMDAVMTPLQERHGPKALTRVAAALAIYLGDAPPNYVDARQRPLFLYMPGLPTQPFFARESFEWVPSLESETDAIRSDLNGVLAAGNGLEPFHRAMPEGQLARLLTSTRGKPGWDSYFFYRHGERFTANCDACPRTIAAVDRVPVARIRDHAPETMFSVLTPGTHILPHRGVTNTRLVVHLPLIVPEDCAIVVGGTTHVWEEGRVMIFDDTFEHEAWNRSERTRAVLILDVWNPHLDEAERDALSLLVPAIGDFNRDCGL